MRAYKFLRDDYRSGYGGEPPWEVGKKRTAKGALLLCENGYHSSPSWYDALNYACGNVAAIVEITKPATADATKYVSRSCTVIQMVNVETVLRAWGCDCAERALTRAKVTDARSWNAIKTARAYNAGTATKDELAAARAAARAAAWAAARDAAWAAARAAAWAAARDAAWADARDAAWAAEIVWQKHHLDELMTVAFRVAVK